MKKQKVIQLALLGLTHGLLLNSLEASLNSQKNPSSAHKPKATEQSKYSASCGAGTCGAIVADNDAPKDTPKLQDPSKVPADKSKVDDYSSDANSENLGYHLMTEDELMLELNEDGVKQYNALSPEGKALARKVASQRCQAANACKGLGGCEDASHPCAGKNACKGKGKCAIADKNLAIRLVAEKMGQKRSQLMNSSGR